MDTKNRQREKVKFTPPSAHKGRRSVNPQNRMSEELIETEKSEQDRKSANHHCKPVIEQERERNREDRKICGSVLDTADLMDNARAVLIEMEQLRASIHEDRRRNQSKNTHTTDRKKNIIQERGSEDIDEEDDSEPYQCQWMVQCSNADCMKWRSLDKDKDPSMLPDIWTCDQSSDPVVNSCGVPEIQYTQLKWAYSSLVPGSLVWAKQNRYPWWPAIVEEDPGVQNHLLFRQESDVIPWKCHVTYMGTPVSRAWLPVNRVKTYADLLEDTVINATGGRFRKRLQGAICMARTATSLTLQMRLISFGFWSRWTDCNVSKDSDVAEVLGLFFKESGIRSQLSTVSDKDLNVMMQKTPVKKRLKKLGDRQTGVRRQKLLKDRQTERAGEMEEKPDDMFAPVENTDDED